MMISVSHPLQSSWMCFVSWRACRAHRPVGRLLFSGGRERRSLWRDRDPSFFLGVPTRSLVMPSAAGPLLSQFAHSSPRRTTHVSTFGFARPAAANRRARRQCTVAVESTRADAVTRVKNSNARCGSLEGRRHNIATSPRDAGGERSSLASGTQIGTR